MNGKSEAEQLMGDLFAFAEKMLTQYGEFHPFGGYVDSAGRVVHVGVEGDVNPVPSREKFEMLKSMFSEIGRSGGAKLFGIAADVVVSSNDGAKGDAVEFWLEHKDGYCAEVFIRYRILGGSVEFMDTTAQRGMPMFFDS